jgi:Ca2+-binding RTX toxin-like protein
VHTTLASYTLGNHVENGRILATGAANLTGNALNNLLYAGTGNNVLDGGAGSDTVTWAYGVSGAVGVTASLASGSASGSGSDTLIGIEHLIGSPNADRLTGDGNANNLSGGLGNDTLDGGAGADTLTGGDGSDFYYIDHLGDQVIETNATAAGGTDLVHTTLASYTLGNHVENGRILASGAANLTGNALNNLLYAGTGNNVLDGGAGSDTVTWAYAVIGAVRRHRQPRQRHRQRLRQRHPDRHRAPHRLAERRPPHRRRQRQQPQRRRRQRHPRRRRRRRHPDRRRRQRLLLHRPRSATRSSKPTPAAAGGTDLVHTTLASYTLGNHVENGRILASGAANLTGNALNNLLYAGTGNNVLDGGAGSDTVTWAYGVSGATGVTASLASGSASGSGSDTLIGIEHLIGSPNADRLTGDGNANSLSGGLGNDTLDGGGGADTLTGGDGNDHYYIDHLGDQVIETNAAAAGGTDLVHTTLASYTLGNHVENGRILASGAANLTGNALNNLLYAGTGNNVLDGGAGSDTVTWAYGVSGAVGVTASLASGTATGSGSDTLIGIEHLIGSANADRLTGDGNANHLSGGLGNDTLDGGGGADTLAGGDGNDQLSGGLGADVFRFDTLPNATTNRDTILDFSVVDDTIQLENAIFTSLAATGTLAAGSFRSGAGVTAAADADDFVIYDSSSGALYYDANGNTGAGPVQIASLASGLGADQPRLPRHLIRRATNATGGKDSAECPAGASALHVGARPMRYSAMARCRPSIVRNCRDSIRQPFLRMWKRISISQRARYQSISSATSASVSAVRLVSRRHSTGVLSAGGSISLATTQVDRMV